MSQPEWDELTTEQARRLYLLQEVHRLYGYLAPQQAVQVVRYLMTGTWASS